jgi:ketosteroid isomerase-like protein
MTRSDDTMAIAVAGRFLAAMSRLDAQGMFAECSAEVLSEFPACPAGAPRKFTSRQAVQGFFSAAILPIWSEYTMERVAVHALADDPQTVVADYASTGSLRDGSPYQNSYLSLFTVQDGKIVRWLEYFDPAPLAHGVAVLQESVSQPTAGLPGS